MSRLEQRVRSVELRSTNLLTSSEIAAAVEIGVPSDGPETVVSASAPYQFKKIQDAYVYPKALTGLSSDRVEIYLEVDTGAAVGDRIEISGIHWATSSPIDVTSDNFTVLATDTPPWDGRKSYMHDPTEDQLSGVTISNTYYFQPETAAPQTWSTRRRLQTRRLVDSFSVTDTTVTLTMNATHHFEVGDVIYVDIYSEDSRAYGVDGLFRVTAVDSTVIEYELDAGVDTPTGDITPVTPVYVFPVAREWAQDGSIWVDSSSNKTYYWDGLRWTEYTPSTQVEADGDPPAPPTSLSVSSTATLVGATYTPRAEVTLSWTAPTQTAAGEELTDLAGYKIRWRRGSSEDWRSVSVFDSTISSYTFAEDVSFQQNTAYSFQLYAFDSGLQDSTAATASHTTAKSAGDHSIYKPTLPVVTSRLGTITVTWDGKLDTGSGEITAPSSIVSLNIYMSTSSGFTPSETNLYKKVRVFGSDGGFDVITDLTYNTTYYFIISVSDTAGVESPYSSPQVAAQISPLVDTDIIYSTLNNWPFADGLVSASALADGSVSAAKLLDGAVEANKLKANAVTSLAIAANAVTAASIAANAVTGPAIASSAITAGKIAAGAVTATTIASGAITSDKITAGAIGATQIAADAITADKISAGAIGADEIAAGAIIAGKIGADAVTAATIAAGAITAGKISTNAITADKIEAGAITAVKISSSAITADKIEAGAITAAKIAAEAITAEKLQADLVLTSLIKTGPAGTARIEIRGSNIANPGIVSFKGDGSTAFRLYSNGISYLDDIIVDTASVSGTITGGTIRTAASGQRVQMQGSTNSLRFYNSSGAIAGEIEGQTLGARFDSSLGAFIQVGGGVTMGSGSTTATSVNSSGLVLLVAPTTTFAANLRRPDAGNVIQVVSSDLRIKENVFSITDGISVVNQLNPVTFNSKVDGTDKVVSGFLAQDVANILPVETYTAVTEVEGTIPDFDGVNPEDFEESPLLSLNHIELLPYLTKAIQELIQKNSDLENRIATLESSGE
jgi:hypothetical protein